MMCKLFLKGNNSANMIKYKLRGRLLTSFQDLEHEDKTEKNKSFDVPDYKKELYDALIKSYNTNKDIIESYGEVFSLKRSRDEKDKDHDPSAGSDRGTKRRKSSKDAESSRDSRSKEKKSSSSSKDASQSRHKLFDKFAHAEEPSHTVEDLDKQQDQERRIIAVTRLKIMKRYDYGHLEEIEVRRDDQHLYTFKEGDFKRLRLQDIEDMLFLLVQQRMTNLTIDERKRLMRTDELHKFSDGTLNDVQSALHDIAAGIRMEYLPMRKWSNLDKKRARVMVQDIDRQLYQRRLMQNLEKFIERFNTTAGNPVKEILLKLNLPDHRSILTDSKNKMTTLAEHNIVAEAKNRPPMLEKSMYDSWASRIRLFIKGKKMCTQPKRPRNAAWFKEKLMLAEAQEAGQTLDEEKLVFFTDPRMDKALVSQHTIPQNSAFQTKDLDAYYSDCDDLSLTKALLMAYISSCDYDVLYEELQDAVIQDTNSSAPNDLLVLSLVEQMTNHVAHLDKEN
nr:hypothetical protein [Tanacetum cinerariifolium]